MVAFSPLNRQSPALEEIQMREGEENKHKRWARGKGDDRLLRSAHGCGQRCLWASPDKDPVTNWVEVPRRWVGSCPLNHTLQGPACPTLGNSEDPHWSAVVPSPSLLPRACFLRAAPPPAWAEGHMCSQGHCQQWECHTGEAGACRKLLLKFPWRAWDTLHRKRQHNFLIKLKSVALVRNNKWNAIWAGTLPESLFLEVGVSEKLVFLREELDPRPRPFSPQPCHQLAGAGP